MAETHGGMELFRRGISRLGQEHQSGAIAGEIFLVISPIPAASAKVGDLLVWTQMPDALKRHARGTCRQLPRKVMAPVGRAVERGAVRYVDGTSYGWVSRAIGGRTPRVGRTPRGFFVRDLLDRRRHRGQDSGSPLWIVRPWAVVTDTIEATTDDAAIFELVHQVGGRMPRGGT